MQVKGLILLWIWSLGPWVDLGVKKCSSEPKTECSSERLGRELGEESHFQDS